VQRWAPRSVLSQATPAADPDTVAGNIIDADLWAHKPSYRDLAEWLDPSWRHWLRAEEPLPPGVNIAIPEGRYFWVGDEIGTAPPVEDSIARLTRYLDSSQIRLAVVNPGAASSVSGSTNPLLTEAIARAVNRWTVERWLDADSRLRGAIVISGRDPERSAAEIRRAGVDGRMVCVLLAFPPVLLGHRSLAPIFDAACELDLPIVLQAGGDYCGGNGGLHPAGKPGSMFEAVVAWEWAGQPHIASLVSSGTFTRFPSLRVVLSGFGHTWLPRFAQRLDSEYNARRYPMPSTLDRLPSEVIADGVHLGTAFEGAAAGQPDSAGERDGPLAAGAVLVYGSGPHRGAEHNASRALAQVDRDLRSAVSLSNALQVYPRLRRTPAGGA
jgi:predicted TIM-barrel fold metal-dependent hydrolase